MGPDDYNAQEYEAGRLTPSMITALVKEWQGEKGLQVDGKAGPRTQASLRRAAAGEDVASSPVGLLALAVAVESLGRGEEGGNNSGPFVETLHRLQWDGDDDDDGAWCAAFVSWCFEQAYERASGIVPPMPFARSGGAKRLYRNIGNAGSFPAKPAPGDVVCWDRGKRGSWMGHVGFVERVEGEVIHTIEGNVGAFPSTVRRMVHDTSHRPPVGYARIKD